MPTPSPSLPAPRILLFDWHGTLVDTQEAMTCAMEDMLNQLEELGLAERLVPESECNSPEDVKLVRYIRIFRRLHPAILLERRVSRTEIFNVIFGHDADFQCAQFGWMQLQLGACHVRILQPFHARAQILHPGVGAHRMRRIQLRVGKGGAGACRRLGGRRRDE